MDFITVMLWVCMVVFLIGVVFVFEATLSTLFGFALVLATCLFFATFFWMESMVIFAVMFSVFALLAIRFIFKEISNRFRR